MVVLDMLEVADMEVEQLEVMGVAEVATEVAPEVTEVAAEVMVVVPEVTEVVEEVMVVVPVVMEERLMVVPKALFSSNRLAMELEAAAVELLVLEEPELGGSLLAEAAAELEQGGNPLEEVAVVLAGRLEEAAAVPVAGPPEVEAVVVQEAGLLEAVEEPVEPDGNHLGAVGVLVVEAVAGGEVGNTKLSPNLVSSSTR